MQIVVAFCRYALPLIAFIILFKCTLTLLIGHPVNKTYGYVVSSINGEKIPLNTWETSIGRSKSCDITLVYGTVSRFHAAICRRVDGWYIFDTNSKLGTFVNGNKIDGEAMIKNADIITFGECNFQFVITDDPVIEVGKKRRKTKKKTYGQETQNKNNTYSYTTNSTASEPVRPNASVERYDDFDSIHIDFHPKNSETEQRSNGRIRDIYSDDGGYSKSKERTSEPIQRKGNTKTQAALISGSGETFLLCGSRITVGRSRNSDIKLDERSVSRTHALLVKKQNKWYISDSGSTYGTLIGKNEVIEPVRIKDGDIISFSNVKMKFVEDYR